MGSDSTINSGSVVHGAEASLVYADGTAAIKPFQLDIPKGTVVYITGPSGSGKTSLLKLLMGMIQPTTGHLQVLGYEMNGIGEGALRKLRQQLGPVFQDFKLLEGQSVMENVLLGMRFLDVSKGEMERRAQETLERVGLGGKASQTVEKLSWGERQRVAIARAVVRNPRLIIADEPTGNLDVGNARTILELLESFGGGETTVIITTHATHLMKPDSGGIHIQMESGNLHWERR